MNLPKTKKGLQSRIAKIMQSLQREKRTYGGYDDSAGNRYLLGPLYLLMDDVDGALKSFRWFEKNFPDDAGEPFQYLCWSLTYFRAGQLDKAEDRLIQTDLMNLYLIPHILGINQPVLDIWHGSNDCEKEYVEYLPEEFERLWDEPAKEWAARTYNGKRCKQFRDRYIEIYRQLQDEPVGPKRKALVHESSDLWKLKWAGNVG